MSTQFPKTREFEGALYIPSRVEANVKDLVVEGTIPDNIKGTFYQVAPDHQYPPMYEGDSFFNGDGMVKAFKFENGKVDLTTRYVQTDRLKAQKKAGRSLNGKYRNIYTNDPLAAKDNSTANTMAFPFNGMLLAMKEDNLPYTMDLETLETTKGQYDFDGQVKSLTFTAHPKICAKTGNLITFAYCAKGDGSKDIAYFEFTPNGKLVHEIWIKGPHAAMIHDCAVTENYIILPVMPHTCDIKRIKEGGKYWEYQPEQELTFGVFLRKGDGTDTRWFKADKGHFPGHVMGSYEKDGLIHVDITIVDDNVFYFFPQKDGSIPDPTEMTANLKRFSFDLNSKDDNCIPTNLNEYVCEFPRIDERYMGQEYNHGWILAFDPRLPYNQELGPFPFQFMNQIAHMDIKNNKSDFYYAGDSQSFQEPIFVPKSEDAVEGDGYIITLMNNLDTQTTELIVLESLNLEAGPIAKVKVPFRLRMSLHGTWASKK